MKLRINDRADGDLAGIFDYTLRVWGITQAEQYRDGLISFLGALAKEVDMGQQTDGLPDNVRRAKYEHHFIFYQLAEDELHIVRVLHERMDHVRHLT